MGQILSKPVTDLHFTNGETHLMRYSSVTMQGWRRFMEDSHSIDLCFFHQPNIHYFGIFDGHSGGSVSKYCARHLGNAISNIYLRQQSNDLCIKQNILNKTYYNNILMNPKNIEYAIIEGFLQIDRTLMTLPGRLELKILATLDDPHPELDQKVDTLARFLYERAHKKRKFNENHINKLKTSFLDTSSNYNISNHISNLNSKSISPMKEDLILNYSIDSKPLSKSCRSSTEIKTYLNQRNKRAASLDEKNLLKSIPNDILYPNISENGTENMPQNISENIRHHNRLNDPSILINVNDDKSKTKEEKISNVVTDININENNKVNACSIASILNNDEEDDKNINHINYINHLNDSSIKEPLQTELEINNPLHTKIKHSTYSLNEKCNKDKIGGPGSTAVVAILKDNILYVANAGDSRCVLSRGGKAIELTTDHKPNLPTEKLRVYRAGGTIIDGRINGTLNLSRAIGDFDFKKNPNLNFHEQMVIAYPEIHIETLKNYDEFFILACDGVWECMDSQTVIDFIRIRIKNLMPISQILDELFHLCLAKTSTGHHNSGLGLDNMTAIIVQLPPYTIS